MRSLVLRFALPTFIAVLLTFPLACVTEVEPDGGTPDPVEDASVGDPLTLSNLGPHLIPQGARLLVPLRADGGTPPYSWVLVSTDDALKWVVLDNATSTLTGFAGAPTASSKPVTIRVRDLEGSTQEGQLLIDVDACLAGSTQACMRTSAGDVCVVGEAFCENGAIDTLKCFEPDGGFKASTDLLVCGAGCGVCDLDRANECKEGVCSCGGEAACPEGSGCCWTGEVRDCFDLKTSVDHCGSCPIKCTQFRNAVRSCTDGACGSACDAGWKQCPDTNEPGHCDTHTDIDVQNCGDCGNACSASVGGDYVGPATCSGGSCGIDCGAGRRCGNSCFNLNNAAHCGGCDTPCSAAVPHTVSAACTSTGTCDLTCEAGWEDCDGVRNNGCEVNLNSDSANCGQCLRQCQGTYNTCSAGECVQVCGGLPVVRCSAPQTCQMCPDDTCDPPTIPCGPDVPCCQ